MTSDGNLSWVTGPVVEHRLILTEHLGMELPVESPQRVTVSYYAV